MSFLDTLDSNFTRSKFTPCVNSLDALAPQDYRELAAFLGHLIQEQDLKCIGLAGGQGTGKTTLSSLLVKAGAYFGERIQVLSIDDFYLTKEERTHLAQTVHPLLATRGPPGTHDIEWLIQTVSSLRAGSPCNVPHFDKGLDDRDEERILKEPVDRVVIEGWCVGAAPYPQDHLVSPINELERLNDPQSTWRTYTMDCLRDKYQTLNNLIDCLVFLKVPDLDAVRRWRLQQESERDASQQKTAREIDEFVAYYERLTLWMMRDTTERAHVVVSLDQDHAIEGTTIRI